MSRHVKGRKSTRPPSVPDVRDQHRIRAAGDQWLCEGCGRSWADLDAAMRAGEGSAC